MEPLIVLLSIAIAAIALSSDVAPAAATRMSGKCCMSSDGGHCYLYRYHMARRAIPHTCSASCLPHP